MDSVKKIESNKTRKAGGMMKAPRGGLLLESRQPHLLFRNRIGSTGHEKILAVSIALHQEKIAEDEMCIDTTVQEKNITFPTDAKQYRKIHQQLLKIAR